MTIKWFIISFVNKDWHAYKMKNNLEVKSNDQLKLFFRLAGTYLNVSFHLVYCILFRDRRIFPYIKNFLYERMYRHLKK